MSKILTHDNALVKKTLTYTRHHNLIEPETTVIVALSGGPDSLFLIHALHALKDHLKISLVAAHLDHQWRSNSHDDVIFCAHVAKSLNIPFVHKKAENITLNKNYNGSQEEFGRFLRRAFLAEVKQQYNAQTIALGHHSDDQQETFFIRLIRGAALQGLSGIKPGEGSFIHPLLECSKQEIILTLEDHGINYLIDQTNQTDKFLRNRIRSKVVPALIACDQRFTHSFKKTLGNIIQADDCITALAHEKLHELTKYQYELPCINYKKLLECHPYLQKQILITWLINNKVPFNPSDGLLKEIIRFFNNSRSTKHDFYHTWSIVKNKTGATILFFNQ